MEWLDLAILKWAFAEAAAAASDLPSALLFLWGWKINTLFFFLLKFTHSQSLSYNVVVVGTGTFAWLIAQSRKRQGNNIWYRYICMHAYILLLLLQLVYVLTELYYIFSCFSRELFRLFLIEPGLVVIVVVARLRSLCFDEEEEARSSYFLGIVRVNDIREEYFKAKQQNESKSKEMPIYFFPLSGSFLSYGEIVLNSIRNSISKKIGGKVWNFFGRHFKTRKQA